MVIVISFFLLLLGYIGYLTAEIYIINIIVANHKTFDDITKQCLSEIATNLKLSKILQIKDK